MRDVSGQPVAAARITVHGDGEARELTTSAEGSFWLRAIAPGHYGVDVTTSAATVSLSGGLDLAAGTQRTDSLRLGAAGTLTLQNDAQATGGERLSSSQVSALPLNKRDFSQLLLLATGTQTDSNGAANFTQQFTVNGQRGTATVFAMDGADTTDPELGGATFSNFNVDAIQEIKSSSGVLPADIGHGAAGYTEVISKPGTNDLHGSLFEFVRNAAFDARNFFDRKSTAEPEGSLRSHVTNSGLLQAVLCGAIRLTTSGNTRAFVKCWEQHRCFRCRPPTSGKASTQQLSPATP